MRRAILLPVSLTLATLTAVAMLGAAYAMTDFTPNRRPDDGQAAAAVLRFYDAINLTLGTGDPGPLEHVVAPYFVDHTARPGLDPNRDGLARYVVGLHAAVPTLRLEVDEVIATDDRVTARLRVEGVEDIAFLDAPGAAVWGPVDVFRVAGGRIVEHWGSQDVAVRWDPLFTAPIAEVQPREVTISKTPRLKVRVDHLTLAPGAILEGPIWASSLIFVQAGRLVLSVATVTTVVRAAADLAGVREPIAAPLDLVVDVGEVLFLPADAEFSVQNSGQTPAVVLAATIGVAFGSASTRPEQNVLPPLPTGISGATIASAIHPVSLSEARLGVTATRATLGPHTVVHVPAERGPVLVMGDHGAAVSSVDELRPGWQPRSSNPSPGREETAILRNTGSDPLVLLVVKVGPDAGDAVPRMAA